ncbi:hypothetical protein MLD52_13220 [Puniceicoccaceae bacterium K14]|nr:hypothetical protein [Puniceicoccaceae bacterium K14]
MYSNSNTIRGCKSGFTLIEVTLATFVGATIMVAAISFMLSMGSLWGFGNDARLYRKHVRGVSRFIENSFQSTGFKFIEESEEEESTENAEEGVYWGTWGERTARSEEFLSFEIDETPGVLIWPTIPLPQVVCSLEVDRRQGLFLLWRSRLEEDFEEEDPRRTLLSPFVVEMKYHYYEGDFDDGEWTVEDEPETETDGSLILPDQIELVFEYKGERLSRRIVIPSVFEGVPVF